MISNIAIIMRWANLSPEKEAELLNKAKAMLFDKQEARAA